MVRLLIVSTMLLLVAVAHLVHGRKIVAAKLIACPNCGLDRMPRLKDWLDNDAVQYDALEVTYEPGHRTELILYDEYGQTAESIDVMDFEPEGIALLLKENDIHKHTAKPEYLEREFEKTEVCSAFRQTRDCDPRGERDLHGDSSCDEIIRNGRSGYCVCRKRSNVEFPCTHIPVTCEDACKQPEGDEDI